MAKPLAAENETSHRFEEDHLHPGISLKNFKKIRKNNHKTKRSLSSLHWFLYKPVLADDARPNCLPMLVSNNPNKASIRIDG